MNEAGRGGGGGYGGEGSFPPFADSLFFCAAPFTSPLPRIVRYSGYRERILKSSFLLSFFSGSNDCYITKS